MPFAALTFSGWNWLWPSAAFLLVCLVLLAWSYRVSPGGPLRWVCLALKVLGLLALAVCLLEPLWFGQRAKPGSNLFAVVADNSEGMQIKDQGENQTRGEQLQKLVDPAQARWLAEMSDTFELRRYVFDARLQATNDFHELVFDGGASGIGAALKTIGERFQGRNLAGVVLLTDGNATDLRDPLPDLSKLPPIYPVVIGKPGAVRDISLQQVAVSQTAFEDAPVTIQADVSVAGFAGQPISAKVIDRDGKVVKEDVHPGRANGEVVPFHFELKPDQSGLSFYKVKTALQSVADAKDGSVKSDEATLANNDRVFVVNRDAGPYRILYVSGRPNWEFKFLNRAVQEDKEIELSGIIRAAKREPKFTFLGRDGETSNPLYRGFGNQNPEEVQQYDQPVLIPINPRDEKEGILLQAGFPRVAEDLYDYHAIILDDLEYEFFNIDQANLLQKFVSERGGGLLMLGGMESLQEGAYARTPIGDMLPVYLDRTQEMTRGPVAGMRFDLTREGWLQPWARIRDNEGEEKSRREAAPAFDVVNRVRGVKPGASVIASLQTPGGGGDIPALVTQRFGRGRTAVLTVGDLWSWGMSSADAHEDMDKTWRQFARWLVSDVPKRVELTVEPQAEEAANSVVLQVRVRDAKYQPLDEANVQVEVQPVVFSGTANPEAAKPLTLRAEPALTEPGLYQVSYISRSTGGYKATATVTNNVGAEIGRAEAGWSVDLAADEFRSLVPNVALMESLARKTGGEVIMADKLEDFVKKLPNLKAPVMESWSYPLWHTTTMFAFALACLLGEWGIRRWKGMP